ncbi:ankyrin repeat-containing domain protein [Mycena sanguinolenta]|nr:ankyrin repeat-containing domain protein [Mycena sanguinolenta]
MAKGTPPRPGLHKRPLPDEYLLLPDAQRDSLRTLCQCRARALGAAALIFAVQNELESTLDKCVVAGISLDTEIIFGRPYGRCSLLHVAAATGTRAMVVKLLEMYREGMTARVHAWGSSVNGTPLDCAASNGHMEIVRLLAAIPGPSPDLCNNLLPSVSVRLETQEEYLGRALIGSTKAGHLEVSQYLVGEGADVNFRDTPLNTAVSSKNLELVQFLLTSGSDPNRSAPGLRRGLPLFRAAKHSSIELVEALLAAGANPHATDEASHNVLAVIRDIKLLWPCLFLERGVNPNHRDKYGRTPLHYACLPLDETAKARIELLLHFGAATIQDADDDGDTPVDLAMEDDRPEIVKVFEPLVHNPELQMKIATWWQERDSPVTWRETASNSAVT